MVTVHLGSRQLKKKVTRCGQSGKISVKYVTVSKFTDSGLLLQPCVNFCNFALFLMDHFVEVKGVKKQSITLIIFL